MQDSSMSSDRFRLIPKSGLSKCFWENNSSGVNTPYLSPTPGEFPIVASSPFAMSVLKNISTLTAFEINDLVLCGFNVGMELTDDMILDRILTVCTSKYIEGTFKYMPSNPSLSDNKYKQFLDKYKNNPFIGGWKYKDEPMFGTLMDVWEQYERIQGVDPTHLIYINLMGIKDKEVPSSMTYADYLDYFQDMFKPGLWSYDVYPITVHSNGELSVKFRVFYEDLQLFSKMANKTKRPFWAYVQSMAFLTPSLSGCPAPKEEYMRYEAFSALAFGAQGIVYWTYAQRNDPPNGAETYSTALLDREGNKTKYWYYAQNVNKEIRKFSPVFYGSQLLKYAHTGNLGVDGDGIIIPPVSIANFGPVVGATSSDKGALFTLLKNEEEEYLVIVNHTPLESSIIDIQFSSKYYVYDLTNCKENDFSDARRISNIPFSLMLQPGAYRIYTFF